jgi:hypothetical protein
MLKVVYAECLKYALYAQCHYADCRYAEFRYAECRGAVFFAMFCLRCQWWLVSNPRTSDYVSIALPLSYSRGQVKT